MIVIPIQFIIALVLAGIGLVLLIFVHIGNLVNKVIKKIRKKK